MLSSLLNKTVLSNYCYHQVVPITILFLLGCYLTTDLVHPLYSIFATMLVAYHSYFVHVLLHFLPEKISVHVNYHHVAQPNAAVKAIHLVIETLVNLAMFAIVYVFQRFLLHVEVIPTILLVYYGMIYTSVHIINYSLFHVTDKHVIHHTTSDPDTTTSATVTKNYGPDLLDHLFGTNDDDTFEDYNHIIPNILIAFFVTYFLFLPLDNTVPTLE